MIQTGFKFLGYRVSDLSLEMKDNFGTTVESRNSLAVDLQQNYSRDNNRFVEIVIRLRLSNENDSLKIGMTIKGGFEAAKEMPDAMFKQLGEVNAPAVLFPYARAIISTLTTQAGAPPVILPLVNFTATNPTSVTKDE